MLYSIPLIRSLSLAFTPIFFSHSRSGFHLYVSSLGLWFALDEGPEASSAGRILFLKFHKMNNKTVFGNKSNEYKAVRALFAAQMGVELEGMN